MDRIIGTDLKSNKCYTVRTSSIKLQVQFDICEIIRRFVYETYYTYVATWNILLVVNQWLANSSNFNASPSFTCFTTEIFCDLISSIFNYIHLKSCSLFDFSYCWKYLDTISKEWMFIIFTNGMLQI